jgi:hypothetical protein
MSRKVDPARSSTIAKLSIHQPRDTNVGFGHQADPKTGAGHEADVFQRRPRSERDAAVLIYARHFHNEAPMPIRKLNINEIVPFDYEFDGPIGGQMADVGRNI